MDAFLLACGSALWLGILTSISPCPLATNVAAVGFVGRRVGHPGRVLLSGVLYTFGRVLTYTGLAAVLVASLLSVPELAQALQKYMNKALGPILIVVGMFLLELISFGTSGRGVSQPMQARVERSGVWGAGLLGMLFALSFCPVSAALYFGSLIPVCLQFGSRVVLPAIYGIGTALPVLAFAVLLAAGAHRVGRAFDKVAAFERWARRLTGLLFIGIGIGFCLVHIFRLL